MKKSILLAVFLCSISAWGQQAPPDCSLGFCAGVGSPMSPHIPCKAGNKYTQLDAPGTSWSCTGVPPNWAMDTGGLGNLSTTLSNAFVTGPTYFFGDSTSTISNSRSSIPQNSGTALLWKDIPGSSKFSYGVSGTLASQIAASELTLFASPVANTAYTLPKVFANGGINDANTCGTANCIANYAAQQQAGLVWMAAPVANKLMASTATITGFSSSATIPLLASVVGTAEKSTTNGNTLSFSGVAAGTQVGITWIATATSGGTFTVSVNGSLVNGCSGTTTWAASGCGTAVGFNTPMRQEFSVTPGAFTVLVTVTSATNAANPVEILDVDSSPTSTAGQPVIFQYGVIKQNADANAATTAAYNASVTATVATLAAENLNVHFVDLRGGTPGVNSTTDMAATSTACPSNANTPLHPNDCGYAHEVQTIENAVAATGLQVFFPNLATPLGPSIVPFAYQTSAPVSTTFADWWNTNTQQGPNGGFAPTLTISSPGLFFFPITGGHLAGVSLLFDPTFSEFGTGFVSDFSFKFLHCPGANTNYTGCTAYLSVDKTTGNGFVQGTWKTTGILAGTLYSASGTALPTCVVGIQGQRSVVSDATAPTYMGAYTSGGAITAEVICSFDGTTFAWKTH